MLRILGAILRPTACVGHHLRSGALACLLLGCVTSAAFGQDAGGAAGGGLGSDGPSAPVGTATSVANPFGASPVGSSVSPSAPSKAVAVGPWLLYPSLLIGSVYNDNLFLTQTHTTGSWGVEFRPNLIATLDNGIHKTTVYGTLDASLYTNNSQGNTLNGRVGVKHVYEAQRGLVFNFGVDVSRYTDVTNNGQIFATNRTNVAPQQYNQFSATAGVEKSFNRFFAGLTANATATRYDNVTDSLGISIPQGYQNGTSYSLTGRAGYWFSPVFYAYVEPSINTQHYNDALFDSNGYRVVAGIGSDRISLFKGEIYAGFQGQSYNTSAFGFSFGDVTGGVFGGKLTWFPTKALTIGLHVDQSLGTAPAITVVNPIGSPTRNTLASATASYRISDVWSASAHADYEYISYVLGGRRDTLWAVGAAINYDFYRDFGIALEYKYTTLNSNIPFGSYTQNIITLGATYKY
jgi:hypothetical protein